MSPSTNLMGAAWLKTTLTATLRRKKVTSSLMRYMEQGEGMRTPRHLVILLLVALIASACGGGDEPVGDDGQPIGRIELAAIPPFNPPSWPMIVADHEGFFDREGVQVNTTFTFDGGTLLAGGQVDVLSDGADSGLIGAAQGADVLFVSPHMDTVTDGFITSPDIQSVEDLPGTTLRSAGFGTDEFLMRRFIEDSGVDTDEINFVTIEDDGAALGQLEQGEIDGGMFGLGALLEAEQTGQFNVLGPPEALGSYPWNVIQTSRAFADANGEALVAFIRAVRDAILFIQDPQNREAVIEAVLAAGEGIPREDVEVTYDGASVSGFEHYTLERLTPQDLQPGLELLTFLGEEVDAGDIDLEELIDNQYFDEATS